MQYIRQHIRDIISVYQGEEPLANFLKKYYQKNRKLGSRDRKILNDMVYAWYRCSKGFDDAMSFDERLAFCLFLCYNGSKYTTGFMSPGWADSVNMPVVEKIAKLTDEGVKFDIKNIARFDVELSAGILGTEWLESMLQQPNLFIRVRKKVQVIQLLDDNDVRYQWLNDDCLSLPNSTPIDKLLPRDAYVIQDASSQQTGQYFLPLNNEQWWDCCAGAGGKSLLLTDKNEKIKLTVSDKRQSILSNLMHRFDEYHLSQPTAYVLDLVNMANIDAKLGAVQFDHIICDAPCTGSGTWARTPEQLYFFDTKDLAKMSALQAKIAEHVVSKLKPGGKLFYITCSVFKQENEHTVEQLLKNTPLQLQHMELINGIAKKADSMFIAVLRKP